MVIDATYKSLEKEYKADLEMNLEASRKKDLTIITPFMRNEWLGLSTDVQNAGKWIISYSQSWLTQVADAVCNLPTDKSLSIK
jgi:2-oxoglutarate dehydrogenase E1 component